MSQVASICQRMNLYLYMYACVTQTLEEEEKSSVHSGQLLSAESDQKKKETYLFWASEREKNSENNWMCRLVCI